MSHLPYVFKPELVRGCTMRCVFCGLRHQEWADEPIQMMSLHLWIQYINAIEAWRPNCRIEIANRGEQTLHPQYLTMVAYARQRLPKCYIVNSTNGDLVNIMGMKTYKLWVTEALNAGVNVFLLDCYTPKRLVDFTELFADSPDVHAFFEDDFNPYLKREPSFRAICVKDATPSPKENMLLHYHNQGNNANVSDNPNALRMYPNVVTPPTSYPRMCTRPFREFPMWYNGDVPICCDDWADEAIVGKFPNETLPELWVKYDPWRVCLINRTRSTIMPCKLCSEAHGKRFGLELDWFKEKT
jgi:hypothetical protein